MPVLVMFVLGFIGPGLTRSGPASPFAPEPYARAAVIRFCNGTALDTRTAPGIPATSVQEPGRYLIVRLAAPVRPEWLAGLAGAGARPVCQLAPQSLVCRADRPLAASALFSQPFVRWLGPFPSAAKLAPELESASGRPEVTVAAWPGEDLDRLAQAVAGLGADVLACDGRTIECRVAAGSLAAVAALDGVAWLQAADSFVAFNRDIQWVMQSGWHPEVPDSAAGRPVWTHGILGQGMVVGLFDSGINTDHLMFLDPEHPLTGPGVFPDNRRIAAYKLYRNASFGDCGALLYHGSAVAGTLAGNDSLNGDSSRYDGVALDARIYFVDNATAYGNYVFDADMTELLDSVRLSLGMPGPVRQASGSFGSTTALGTYRLEEATVDATCWLDKHFLVVWAAGNYGIGSGTIAHPSCAKDIITVGATGNGVESNTLSGSSSTGPTSDGRIKPDMVAPGVDVFTVDGGTTDGYVFRSGTSFSAPAVSGALLLFRQYLAEGWFPLGLPDSSHRYPDPTSALMRACALAGADADAGTDSIPNYDAGWGRLDLSRIMHFAGDSVGLTFAEDTFGLAAGQVQEYHFQLADRRPLSVVLAWTDTAAPPSAAVTLVNDLDLELESPDQNHYRGNQFVNGQSAANPPAWDSSNVEEVCHLRDPLAGDWTVRVYGRNIYTARQPYAFVVRGGLYPATAPGVAEAPAPARLPPATAIVRGGLRLALPPGARFALYSADGRLLRRSRAGGDEARLAGLAPGVYYYVVESKAGGRVTGKAVVVR